MVLCNRQACFAGYHWIEIVGSVFLVGTRRGNTYTKNIKVLRLIVITQRNAKMAQEKANFVTKILKFR